MNQTHYNQNFNICSFNLDLAEILGKKAIDKWENMFYERDDISIVVGIFGKGIKNKGIWNYVLFLLFYVLDSFYLFIFILKIYFIYTLLL